MVKTESSPWISNILVVRTIKDQVGCALIHIRQANMAIIPSKYPLPTVEELASEFHGSIIFIVPQAGISSSSPDRNGTAL